MIRPPSLQRNYDTFYSGDESFTQLVRGDMDDAAWAAAVKERIRVIGVCRETGDWSQMLSGKGEPSKFTLRQVPGDVFRALVDGWVGKRYGAAEFNQLMFRAAIVSVTNIGDAKVEQGVDDHYPQLGKIATTAITNLLDGTGDMAIVNEIASVIRDRQQALSGK